MWRVFQNALPVDSNFQCKGINLASKCVCLQSPSHETLEHLLIHSNLIREVKGYFAYILHK